MSDWIATLANIVRQMAATGVTELEVRQGDLKLRLRRDPAEGTVAAPRVVANEAAPAPGAKTLHQVSSPLTGIYYASPNPTSQPYVAVGDWLEPDTVVGLIETMKVFNEVTADCRGRVTGILAQQGQLVHAGEPILLVDLHAAPDTASEVGA